VTSPQEGDPLSALETLTARLAEAEETLRAIRSGEVDALVVAGDRGDQVFTLRGADHSYRVFLEAMHEGAATLAADGTLLYCNRRFAEIVATPLEDVIGGSIHRFVRAADRPALDAILREGLAAAASQGELTLLRGADLVPVYLAASRLRLEEVEAVCLVVTDLTEQKSNEQVVASEKLARSIFEHASEAIVVCDTEERVLRASNSALRLCAGNPVGECFSAAFPLFGEGPEPAAVPFGAVCAGRVVRGIEASLTLANGETRRLQVSAGPLLAADGGVLGCVLTLTDITARRRAELEVDRARREAEAASQAKDHFLATLSHELRTPLTPVLAVISGLQGDGRLPDDVRRHLAMMRRNVELEARLIDDMLDLTRIARGKLELRREVADLKAVIHHALQTANGALVEKRQRLVLDLAPCDHAVWADTPRLTQVFWNLFSNAVKFTPPEGAIAVRSRCEPGLGLTVEVADTGIGIEPEVLDDIFDAFQQGTQTITRRFGGLGLGLAISKAIVELHGGSLTATSEGQGQGAIFSVRLPTGNLIGRAASTAAAGALPAAAKAPGPPQPPGVALHILLVEDHVDTAAAMADLLRDLGYEVTVAGTVAAGLASAARLDGRVDLVLSDLGLPDGTGLELMAEIHQRYGVKGIALSGYGMEEDVRRSLEAGFDRHLTKPINLQALQTAIEETTRRG
jgi:two-component system, chemotaxis family, CheB/CheR fusion protein